MIVGRAGELAQLDAALGETRAGKGRLVLLAGAPGIGKSRLADAAAERAKQAGMTIARGYAVDEPGAPPLWPWLRLMRSWDDATQLPVPETWDGDAAARFQLFTAVTTLVCGHATGDGLLLILEDMHWADRTSVRLLRHLVAAISDEPMAVLVTYRNTVPGPLLDAALLAEMTGRADLGPALDEAVATGILREDSPPGWLRFEHALVRDAVYAELTLSRRGDLHRRAAQLLIQVGEPNVAGLLASHWRRAGGRDAAGQCQVWAEQADIEARRALAYDDAVRYAELALNCAVQADGNDAERARLLIRLAEAQFLANAVEHSVRSCAAAADLAEAARRADLLAQAGLVVHGIGSSAYRTIAGICERALALLWPDEHATRARLHAQLAVGIAEREGGPRAADLAAQACTEAERSGDPQAILEALAARHLAISIPQAVAERLELGRQAVALGRSARHPVAALWGHLWRADAALQLGNLAEADHELAEIDRVATVRRSVLARWHHHRFRAVLAAQSGDFATAWAANEDARQLAVQAGDISMTGLSFAFQLNMAVLLADPGLLGPGWKDVIRSVPPADQAAGAAAEFRRLDMPARASEAAKVAADIAARRRTASPLSAREEEVASLVAQALTNRQIAERLILSERTVETHVRSILAKLNFSTRTEIATWVLRTSSPSAGTGT